MSKLLTLVTFLRKKVIFWPKNAHMRAKMHNEPYFFQLVLIPDICTCRKIHLDKFHMFFLSEIFENPTGCFLPQNHDFLASHGPES